MKCDKIISDKNCNLIVQEEFDIQYAYVYILQLNKTNNIINQVFIKSSSEDQVIFDIKSDGFYTLMTIKVPLDMSNPYYYKDGKFYKNIQEVDIQELIESNPEYSKLDIQYDYYFQKCRLKQCYVNICQQIFDQRASIDCNSNGVDKNLIYKRDLILSTLNVIDYMVEIDQYEEAERLLERISGCNGLCTNNKNNCGCGE